MRALIIALACAAALAAGAPAQAATSATLAKKCRAMMVQAHPSVMFGLQGTATMQRDYFNECVRRNGNMAESSAMPDRHQPE
jgi:hypothetical protein